MQQVSFLFAPIEAPHPSWLWPGETGSRLKVCFGAGEHRDRRLQLEIAQEHKMTKTMWTCRIHMKITTAEHEPRFVGPCCDGTNWPVTPQISHEEIFRELYEELAPTLERRMPSKRLNNDPEVYCCRNWTPWKSVDDQLWLENLQLEQWFARLLTQSCPHILSKLEICSKWSWSESNKRVMKLQMKFSITGKVIHMGKNSSRCTYTIMGSPLAVTVQDGDLGIIFNDFLKQRLSAEQLAKRMRITKKLIENKAENVAIPLCCINQRCAHTLNSACSTGLPTSKRIW